MSNDNNNSGNSNDNTSKGGRNKRTRGRGRRFFFLTMMGAMAVGAFAWARGGGFGHQGNSACGHGHGELDAEQLRERADFFVERFTGRIDATDEQADQINALLDEALPAFTDHKALSNELRDRAHDALTGEQVDKEALEQVRVDTLNHADQASAQALDFVTRLADILTPEQRADLASDMERMKKWHR